MSCRRLATGLYGAAALIGAGAFVSPPLSGDRDDVRANATADAGLQRLAEGERALFAATGKYAGFGPASTDRAAVLPHVHLGAEFDDLSFDALLDHQGALQLRVVSRVDAVRAGRISPLLKRILLVDPSKELPNNAQ